MEEANYIRVGYLYYMPFIELCVNTKYFEYRNTFFKKVAQLAIVTCYKVTQNLEVK